MADATFCTWREAAMTWRIVKWIASLVAICILAAISAGSFLTGGPHVGLRFTFLFWAVAAAYGLSGRLLGRPLSHIAVAHWFFGSAAVCAFLAVYPSAITERLRSEAENRRDWVAPLAYWLNEHFGPLAVAMLFALASSLFIRIGFLALRDKGGRSQTRRR